MKFRRTCPHNAENRAQRRSVGTDSVSATLSGVCVAVNCPTFHPSMAGLVTLVHMRCSARGDWLGGAQRLHKPSLRSHMVGAESRLGLLAAVHPQLAPPRARYCRHRARASAEQRALRCHSPYVRRVSDYDGLELLMTGYLNQDWDLDYDDTWAAVEDFARSEPEALRVVDEVRKWLAASPTEEMTRDFLLYRLGSDYIEEMDGSYRIWLAEVAARVESLRNSES